MQYLRSGKTKWQDDTYNPEIAAMWPQVQVKSTTYYFGSF